MYNQNYIRDDKHSARGKDSKRWPNTDGIAWAKGKVHQRTSKLLHVTEVWTEQRVVKR